MEKIEMDWFAIGTNQPRQIRRIESKRDWRIRFNIPCRMILLDSFSANRFSSIVQWMQKQWHIRFSRTAIVQQSRILHHSNTNVIQKLCVLVFIGNCWNLLHSLLLLILFLGFLSLQCLWHGFTQFHAWLFSSFQSFRLNFGSFHIWKPFYHFNIQFQILLWEVG